MLPAPKLDARSAAKVREQAQELAAHYLGSAWKGVDDPKDPAFQLLDVFSRLMEILITRLNGVPDKNFMAFLDMVGIERSPGTAASVPVTFLPSAKAPEGGPIPAGTKVATTQTDQADAQIFETNQAIHATAAKLVACVNVLPDADSYSLIPLAPIPPVAPKAGTPQAAAPEATLLSDSALEVVELPHVLYLGGQSLFGRKEKLDILLVFSVLSGDKTLLDDTSLEWEKFDKDLKTWQPTTASYPGPSTQFLVKLEAFEKNDKQTIAGREDFWVRCHFKGGFPPGRAFPSFSAVQAQLQLASAPAIPEKAFANATALDLSKPFKPFGDRPRYGDAFYLTSQRAFAPEVQDVTVTMKLKLYSVDVLKGATAVTTLVEWQYLDLEGEWETLATFEHTMTVVTNNLVHTMTRQEPAPGSVAVTTAEDGTFFGNSGAAEAFFTFGLPPDMGSGKVHGEEGLWIRALLRSDDPYGKEASLVPGNPVGTPPTVRPATLIPPVVEAASLTFTYKAELQDVTAIVTDNNLTRLDRGSTAVSATHPLTPFVGPNEQRVHAGTALAFAGGGALYLGFDRPFGDVYISLYFKLRDRFPSPTTPAEQGEPRLAWEYSSPSSEWKPLDIADETGRLTSSGTVSFLGPSDAEPTELFNAGPLSPGRSLYWYRARLTSGSYQYPPRLHGIYPNTVLAENRFTFQRELVIGSGSGEENQRLLLLKTPVLGGELWVREPETPPRSELDELRKEQQAQSLLQGDAPLQTEPVDPKLVGSGAEVFVRWGRVPNFLGSGARSRHYTFDPVSGEIRFGNGRRGMLPPVAKDNLVFRDYRVGGGETAVRAAVPLAVKELKSSLPYVEKVFNVEGASGGSAAWGRDEIFLFGPQIIKNKRRAVSAEDFEWMVLERFSQLARVKCISTRAPGSAGLLFQPGAVTMIVVPKGNEPAPRPTTALLRLVQDFLKKQCLGNIVSDVHVLGPEFRVVTVKTAVRARDPRESGEVERRAATALDDFFHPLHGGEARRGWDFGRKVQRSEVFAVLQRVAGVDYVASAEFVENPAANELDIGETSLVTGGSHRIEMI